MEYKEWLKNLKVGDKVIVSTWSWSSTSYREAIVEKITPKGFIKVEGRLYYPNTGEERRGDSFCSSSTKILDPNDEETQRLVTERKIEIYINNTIYKLHNIKDLTFEQAVKFRKVLEETTNEGN